MQDVEVITEPGVAAVALDPVRALLLSELREPASAAALAERVGLARQKVNYHLRTLEAHGLVEVAETRRWGGLTERLLVATAAGYVISPDALNAAASDPARTPDRLSAAYLIALAARVLREVGGMARHAAREDKQLVTLGLDTEVRFRSPAERAAFGEELAAAVTTLVARYHAADASDGRWHRVLVAAHPLPADADQPVADRPSTAGSTDTGPTRQESR
jgi:DNA-binding transcriptional ArsR family regulator